MSIDIRMENIENEIKSLKKTIEDKVPTMDKMELSNRKLVDEVIDKCDKRYANKSIERDVHKLLWGFIGVTFSVAVFVVTNLISKGIDGL